MSFDVRGRAARWFASRGLRLLTTLVILGALLPLPSFGAARILGLHDPKPDLDVRSEAVQPSAQQRAIVSDLDATVTWNLFGTPQSLIHRGGFLGTGYSADPATAARDWLRDHSALFGLSVAAIDELELVNTSNFTGSDAAAVLFRQRFGGLQAAPGGLITVGVRDGNIAYVSSSAAGEQSPPGPASLSATAAWLRAAANVGYSLLPSDLGLSQLDGTWKTFKAVGLSQLQRVRLVAFPTPGGTALPAFETIVLNVGSGGRADAYTVFVDAQTGGILARLNRVNRLREEPQLATRLAAPQVFQGSYTDAPDPAACGPLHGPYAVPAGTQRIVVAAAAAVVANDIYLELYQQSSPATPIATGDVATSPETLVYEPAGGVPAGNYLVRVCPYSAPTLPATAPYSYVGAITWDDTVVPSLLTVPRWSFFLANPPLSYASTDNRVLGCWTLDDYDGTPIPGCDRALDNLAARGPWDYSFKTGTPTFTTIGNAALTGSAWLSPLTPAEGYRPISATRNYDFPWANTWRTSRCSPLSLTPPILTAGNDLDAATVSLFTVHNRMHDWSYFLGFTERNYNTQVSNFGLTQPTQENDPQIGDVQAGALTGGYPTFLGRDNANQIALNDGIPTISNMYLWQPIAGSFYAPCVDGDYDMGVIGHEYTHAISNRMVGGPDDGLTGAQAGAMGEAWSDLAAVEYLNEYGFVPTAGEHPFSLGAYVTGNPEKGIRNYNMSRNLTPSSVLAPLAPLTTRNPLDYGNIGYDLGGVEVHSDGEVWVAVNYDLRQLLAAKYDASYPSTDALLQSRCADGELPVDQCPGNRRWIQNVFDAFLLMQGGVSMLDARDAYLAADVLRTGGANQQELWLAFAGRGMGKNAVSAGTDDPHPQPSYQSPLTGNVDFTFSVLDRDTLAAIPATVYVGHYEARAYPFADTDSATTLGATNSIVSGVTLDLLVRADGYGHVRFPLAVAGSMVGVPQTVTVKMAKNLASSHQGATATGDGINVDKLIDDTETTNWASLTAPVAGDKVTVDLAGGVQKVSRVSVSAMLRPTNADDADSASQGRFTALRQFEIWTCTSGANLLNPSCLPTLLTGFIKIYTSPADAFPGAVPRPAIPDLLLREFDVPDTNATHVQLRVVTTQCTGNPAFLGEQDADPLNATDCATVSADGGRVRAAELQVFTASSSVTVSP